MNRLLRGSVGVVIIVGGSMLAQANEVTDWNEMLFRASAVASGNASPLNITRTVRSSRRRSLTPSTGSKSSRLPVEAPARLALKGLLTS